MFLDTKKITILIPSYNEEESIPLLYVELKKVIDTLSQYIWEILFVNDGSKDKTLEVIKELRTKDERVNYIDLSRNFGKENAMLAGFDYATGDCMIIMDADLQHPPHIITDMLAKWEEGFDDVYAKRLTRGKESWLRKKMSLLFYKILQRSTRIEMLPNVGDFRLLDRKCINALKQLRESERYTKGMFCWIGFKKTFVEFQQKERVAGTSSWNFLNLLGLGVEGIVSFSTSPLRISTILGLIVSMMAIMYMICIIIKAIFFGETVAGYPTILSCILFLGGIQLLCLGIIGEYIARIFNESKNRPIYMVREYNGLFK